MGRGHLSLVWDTCCVRSELVFVLNHLFDAHGPFRSCPTTQGLPFLDISEDSPGWAPAPAPPPLRPRGSVEDAPCQRAALGLQAPGLQRQAPQGVAVPEVLPQQKPDLAPRSMTKLSNLRKASCFTQVDQKTILKKKKMRASRLARESSRGQDAWVMGQNVFPSYEDVKSLDKYARFLLSACLTSSNKHLVTHHYPSATELRGDQFARPSAVRRTGCDAVSLFGDN